MPRKPATKRGRPRKPERKVVYSARMSALLRKALEAAAAESGLGLSGEIELRLQQSFELETIPQAIWGRPETMAAFEICAEAVDKIETLAGGRPWFADHVIYAKVEAAILEVLRALAPEVGEWPHPEIKGVDLLLGRDVPRHAERDGRSIARMVLADVALVKPYRGAQRGTWYEQSNSIRQRLRGLAVRLSNFDPIDSDNVGHQPLASSGQRKDTKP